MIFGNEISKIITEKNVSESNKTNLINLYMHMLKYKYQKSMQTGSWVKSIINGSITIKDDTINKNNFNELNSSIKDCYDQAIKNASKETGLSVSSFPPSILDNFKLSSVIDLYSINKYLWNNAKDESIREYIRNNKYLSIYYN